MDSVISETEFNWEIYARCYDSLNFLHPYRNMLYSVARTIPRGDSTVILDASCGTGNLEKIILSLPEISFGEIIGIDASPEMLIRAREKTRDATSISYTEADLNNPLLFSDNSITQIVSINTLYAVTNPEETLREMFRVLTPGGQLILVTPKTRCENGFILREHCGSNLPDSFWKSMHRSSDNEELLIREAIHDENVVQQMLLVGRYNRSIVTNKVFHFFDMNELYKILTRVVGFKFESFDTTYADQALFFVVSKP